MLDTAELDTTLVGIRTATLMLPFLGAAVASDILHRRIPNILVALMLACGLAVHLASLDDAGSALLASGSGAAVGFLILLPFYALGGMGAGDVKLLAAVGSFFGPSGALLAGIFTLVAGALLGLAVIACRYLRASALSRCSIAASPPEIASEQLPYSVAISLGTLAAVMQW
jgi:prepilin peptidase CpaA